MSFLDTHGPRTSSDAYLWWGEALDRAADCFYWGDLDGEDRWKKEAERRHEVLLALVKQERA